jgi:glutamate carboxypeptidase
LIDLLRELVEIESPTYSAGVRAVAERMAQELERLGAQVELLVGDHLLAELPGEGKPLLVLGHTDTVWPEGTLERMPFRVADGRAYGPGVYDMKGCLVVLLDAIGQAGPSRRSLRVFLTADEEQGSRGGRPHLERAAEGVAATFVVEPPSAQGHLKTARKGLGRFRISVTGRSAHVAADPPEGASAIEELAHQILALYGLNDAIEGLAVNVGVVRGGTSENVVAADAEAQIDVRVASAADLERAEQLLRDLRPALEGTSIALSGEWTRPPLERTPGSAQLFAKAREHGRAIGLDLEESSSGGGSDGNLVAALGVPVLDGLGVRGAGAHSPDEHILLDSLPERAALLARLLQDPGL